MANNMTLLLTLLILTFFGWSTTAERRNPLKDPQICGRPQCNMDNNKFAYSSTIRYKYDYQMHVRTEFSGSGQNTSDVSVTARVLLTFPKRCEGVLSVTNVELREEALPESNEDDENDYNTEYSESETRNFHPQNEPFSRAIQRNELRFSFHDGLIGEICPSLDDDNWILNFKKGILSTIQNSMKRFDIDYNTTETDVAGACDVSYILNGASGTSLLLTKSKDIKSCRNRYKTNSFLQTVPYEFRQNFAIWPILKSHSNCNITVDHSIYEDVKCFERHQLMPFSNNQSGAVTESSVRLKLVDEDRYEPGSASYEEENDITTRATLLFNHYPSPKPTHGEIKTSRELLKKMCSTGFPDIQRDFIDVFTKFLQTTRMLSYTALEQLLARSPSICMSYGKNHVLESLPYIGSTASVQIMRDQILKGSVSNDVIHTWMSSLTYLPRPNEEVLEALYSLLEYGKINKDPTFVLVSTAVAHTFCRNYAECEDYSGIQNILQFLTTELESELRNDVTRRDVRERIIVLLKGIGNVGVAPESLIPALLAIIENDKMPIDIRLQSIYAHIRFECDNKRMYFLEIYENLDEIAEIRIAAYQQAMRCPDYILVKRIKNVLTHEEVNQVGSYVWSHLTNLAKSASPVNVEVQGLLVDEELGTKYKLDIRKFSRNFENSLFFDDYNFGVRSDSNLIFGTESYMPRSIGFNFTADLFGESVNMFEISTRMQGFEHMVESIFGPMGPLNAQGFKDKFDFLTKYWNETVNTEDLDYLDKFNLRFKRDVNSSRSMANPLEKLQDNVNSLDYRLKYNFNEPRASIGLKMFGNDIQYKTVEGKEEFLQALQEINPVSQLRSLFSGKEVNYTKSGIFMDVSYDVPLSCGFPLSIHAFGASSVDIRMFGSLKDSNFLTTKILDIEGKLKPSISVDVMATMQTDYFYGASGVRLKSNLYSSSSVDTKLKIRGNRLGSLQFSLPQDRNDIFSAKSELLVLKYDKNIPQIGISKRYTNSTCTWPFIDRAVGLQVCSEYSLPDVNNATSDYPSLILSGPISLNIHLDKSDRTAKTFLFEYRWDTNGDMSKGSISFNTPDSAIPRIFTANITTDPENYNVSMSFQNGNLAHSAVGTYKNNSDETRLEVYFNLDGNKNLAFEMGVNRTDIRNGRIYYPRFILSINNERIAGLTGTLKRTDKKQIVQHDISLIFETKRVQTQLTGYIVKTEVSTSTKLLVTYRFLDTKPESVEIEGEIADRSQKSRTEYQGAFKLKSSAYPNVNFASNLKFIKVLGHMEAQIDLNNAVDLIDPNYTLTLKLTFARFTADEKKFGGSRTSASIELIRPKSNIDLKFMIKHEEKYKNGPENNFLVIFRYAPKKEGTAVLSLLFPRGHLFSVDAVLNVTVPTFDSCVVALRLIEKSEKDYNIDLKGTWFTGHSISIKGVYQDKSSFIKNSHHLKLVVLSPHFNETKIDLRYWRDESELTFDTQVEYGNHPYGVLIQHSDRKINERTSYAQLKILDKIYSISANLMSQDPRQLTIEIHIDKTRDIHLILRGLSNELKKEAGIEVQWDANRDPTQKLAISVEFNTPNSRMYDGSFQIAYPERTFSGAFDLYGGGQQCKGTARVGWSSYESVEIKFDIGNRLEQSKELWANIKLTTPFEGWHSNSINTGFFYYNNLVLANASLIWADNQNLGISFFSDYVHIDPDLKLEFKVELNSTVKDVPTASAYFKHSHNQKRIDTDVKVKHTPQEEPSNVFSVKSGWQFDMDDHYQNITGSIALRSPVEGYQTGALSTKFSLSDKKQLRGGADLELQEKKYTLLVDGHAKKFTDNMFMINITTPLDKFRNIIGRLGLNERERHVVAEVRAPNGALGIEILWAVNTASDFDVKFNLETPLEAFQKIMVIGKIKPETIEFMGGWNQIVLGYVGVWRMVNLTDFEYSYKVYTPLENFTENGFVAKFVRRKEFDLELSIKFAKYKLGIVMNAKPKPILLKLLGLQKAQEQIRTKLLNNDEFFENSKDDDEDEDGDEDDMDDTELLNFIGSMEFDTLVWPTIYGILDFDEIDDNYYAHGQLTIPHGVIELRNRLEYPDLMNIKNTLKIDTPYEMFKTVKSRYSHSVEIGSMYTTGLEFQILNHTNWIELGFLSNYTKTMDETDLKTHDLQVSFKTPIPSLQRIEFKGNIELEYNTYRGNVSAKTDDTALSFAGSFEAEENFLDTTLALHLSAPAVQIFACSVFLKKELTDVDNSIDLGFEIREDSTLQMLRAETVWHIEEPNYVRVKGKIRTNIIPIKVVETSILLSKAPNPMASLDFAVTTVDNRMFEYHARANRKKEFVSAELLTPIPGFTKVSLQGTLGHLEQKVHTLKGKLFRNSNMYDVDGSIQLNHDIPTELSLKFQPVGLNASDSFLTYSLKDLDSGYGKTLRLKVMENDQFIQIGSELAVFSKISWRFLIAILASEGILHSKIGANRVDFLASLSPTNNDRILGNVNLKTPWEQLGIDSINLNTNVSILNSSGNIYNTYDLPTMKGDSSYAWTWMPGQNMQIMVESVIEPSNKAARVFQAGLKFVDNITNKNKNNGRMSLGLGANLNVNSQWQLEANGTVTKVPNDMGGMLSIRLPQPIGDVHKFNGRYRGNLGSDFDNLDVSYDVKYETEESQKRFASRGQYRNVTDLQGIIRLEWGHDMKKEAAEANMQMLRKEDRREFSARVATPYYTEDSLTASGSYDTQDIFKIFTGRVNYPATRQIADTDISFSSLSNMKLYINCTTPFQNLTWLRGDFDFVTTGSESNRYIKGSWPQNSAHFDLKSTFTSHNLDRDIQGIIKIEIPLTTRHYAQILYGLKERQSIKTGHCIIDYNARKVLDGQYTCKSESRAGFEKDVVDITLENEKKPIGITYVHVQEQSGIDSPQYDMKRAEVFDLRNSKSFNITGEFHVRSTLTGQDYKIVAIHPNRTVILSSDFDIQEKVTTTNSKLQLAENVWIAYNFRVENRTKDDNESQSFNIQLSYPKRSLSAVGWYAVTEKTFDSDLSFNWTENKLPGSTNDPDSTDYETSSDDQDLPRVMRAALQWRDEPLRGADKVNQSIQLSIRHPSFQEDVTFKGVYYRSPIDLLKTKLDINYCDDPDHFVSFEAIAQDLSTLVGYRNYSFQIVGVHAASELDLNANGSAGARPSLYELSAFGGYKRGYLPLQEGMLISMLDLKSNEIRYWKITPQKTFHLWGKADGTYPIYRINGSLEDSPDTNSTGRFYANWHEKLVRLEVNMTPDASQNLRMYGSIPDARSASFNLYRDYEEIRVVDIAYYLRMNHSRLVTSQLVWRPTLKSELKNKFMDTAVAFYDSITENADFWVKTLYTESMDTVNDIWENAKPHTQQFLDDVGGLRVLESDIEDFRIFLNQSYEANDFYVKTVVNFTMTILDELSIRDHIDSVPKILNEMWQVLGDSGKALRKSILWLIDTIRQSYSRAAEIIGRIFHGEAMIQLSAIMEKGVAKYDKIVKDLHVSFIKYVQNMYLKVSDSIINYWKKSLQRIEPSLIKFMYHIESLAWNISKEILDFLYKRTNEIVESPYFNKVSNFTQDLDRLYKDIVSNDLLTNVKKYSALGWQFVKEKYFKLVPFGKEMNDVLTELVGEIKKLAKVEAVQFILSKINEMQNRIEWFANEFQVEKRVKQLWDIVRKKISTYSQTALQTDDKYREAKTKFIFDPDVGVIQLEQKLPMSWHAFNETPIFEEISEYRHLLEVQEFFNANNISIWTMYYEYKPYLDPNAWLPPYKAHSLLIGSRHYMTFDKKFVSLNSKFTLIDPNQKPDQCSYLLAHDFFDRNFTLVLEPSITKNRNDLISTRKLALLTDDSVLDIDIIGSAIRIGRNVTNTLPIQIGQTVIYRDADVLIIESKKGFHLNCNLQFDLCWFELSGWYFGKTAGLLGNMNNEEYDDFNNQLNGKSESDEEFINSWSFENCKQEHSTNERNISEEVVAACDGYFRSKVSYFVNCFPVVDAAPFYDMCLDLGTNSYSNVINDAHPAQKGLCTIALAYIESCAAERTPLRIPDACIHCDLVNGSYVPEGTFIKLEGDDLPKTSDIVFIVEAKQCNKDITTQKNIINLVNTLNKEFTEVNITKNRYSLIAFGGLPPFDSPRSIVHNNEIFTDYSNIKHFFNHIQTGPGKVNDVFDAISMASKLVFRPGASKTFILFPCSACVSNIMKFDYSSILQVMLEENINLHILMDQEFDLDKKRIERVLFGMDKQRAFTKKFLKDPTSDADLRRQVKLPKEALGICVPLALETNGTIFSARKMMPSGKNPIKKFTSVFSKRVAMSAGLSTCQMCECTGHNTGTAYMTCTHCNFPSASSLDYGFNEEEMLDIMQAGTDFNWEWEDEEEQDN